MFSNTHVLYDEGPLLVFEFIGAVVPEERNSDGGVGGDGPDAQSFQGVPHGGLPCRGVVHHSTRPPQPHHAQLARLPAMSTDKG